jgi:hypothetical protein
MAHVNVCLGCLSSVCWGLTRFLPERTDLVDFVEIGCIPCKGFVWGRTLFMFI